MPPALAATTEQQPTGTMRDIASFRAGVQNGETYTVAQLAAAVANFKRFAAGSPPHYTPYLSINHDNGLSFGRVSDARLDGDTLHLSAADLPHEVADLVAQKRLRQPSIEFFLPDRRPDGTIDGFRDERNQVVTTPVIKALTLLGNQPPGVKGLPDLPFVTFAHPAPARQFGGRVRCFSGDLTMDRPAMLAALQAAGVDTSAITDAVPDEVLTAFLTAIQGAAQAADPAGDMDMDGTPNDQDPTPDGEADGMGDAPAGDVQIAPGTEVPATDAEGKPITVKFSHNGKTSTVTLASVLAGHAKQLAALRSQVQGREQHHKAAETEAKRARVRVFLDEMCSDPKGARLLPVQRADYERLLMAADATKVAKFADGKVSGTALDEQMRAIRGYPIVRTFGDRLAAPMADAAGMTAERRKQLLSYTDDGKAALRAIAAAGK